MTIFVISSRPMGNIGYTGYHLCALKTDRILSGKIGVSLLISLAHTHTHKPLCVWLLANSIVLLLWGGRNTLETCMVCLM